MVVAMTQTNRFALTFETLAELAPEIRSHHTDPKPGLPFLSDVLAEYSPLPEEAMFIGIANDGLPVLLNLLDPVPGPILIAGDAGSGKTNLLQTIARGIDRLHASNEVKYVVFTERQSEWNSSLQFENCDGVLDPKTNSTNEYLGSLVKWAHNNRSSEQVLLLLIDDLMAMANTENTSQLLRWLLLRGPSKHIWPVVTLNASKANEYYSWLGAFRTRIFGEMQSEVGVDHLDGTHNNPFKDLIAGAQFTMREGSAWLSVWIPNLD